MTKRMRKKLDDVVFNILFVGVVLPMLALVMFWPRRRRR